MKRVLLIIISLLLISGGIYGYIFFTTLNNAEQIINLAIVDIKSKNYTHAETLLKKAISEYQYRIVTVPAYFLLGKCFEAKKDYSSAVEAYKEAISLSKGWINSNWKYQSLIYLSRIFRTKKIKVSKDQLILLKNYLDKNLEEINEEISILKNSKNSIVKLARNSYSKLISIGYSIPIKKKDISQLKEEMLIEKGYLLISLGEYKEALNILLKIDDFNAKYGAAIAYLEIGKLKEGLDLLSEILKYDKNGKIKSLYINKLYDYSVSLYRNKNYKDSIRYLKNLSKIKGYPEISENSLYLVAEYYYKRGNYTHAIEYYKKIIGNRTKIKDGDAYYKLGLIYYDKKNYIKALKYFNSYLKKYPSGKKRKEVQAWKDICERSIKYFN